MKQYIDLRSDTVTKPSQEMREFMVKAEVGDDVYGEDPTVNELQDYVVSLLGKEAALFVPSGTMSNQIALAINTNTGDEIICEEDAHIYKYETAGPSIISRIQVKPIHSENSIMNTDDIINAIRPDDYYFPVTSLICLENTHNSKGGRVAPLEYIKKVANVAKSNKLNFHLDGARLWNASIAAAVSPKEYVQDFDTISVCLSKGLGAPIGSVLVSSKERIKKALKIRKILGGGMRQAGILAAAGLFALKNNINRLADDHKNAKDFAVELSGFEFLNLDLNTVETNMVFFVLDNRIPAADFIEKCKQKGVLIGSSAKQTIRAVFHLDVDRNDTFRAVEIIKSIISEYL